MEMIMTNGMPVAARLLPRLHRTITELWPVDTALIMKMAVRREDNVRLCMFNASLRLSNANLSVADRLISARKYHPSWILGYIFKLILQIWVSLAILVVIALEFVRHETGASFIHTHAPYIFEKSARLCPILERFVQFRMCNIEYTQPTLTTWYYIIWSRTIWFLIHWVRKLWLWIIFGTLCFNIGMFSSVEEKHIGKGGVSKYITPLRKWTYGAVTNSWLSAIGFWNYISGLYNFGHTASESLQSGTKGTSSVGFSGPETKEENLTRRIRIDKGERVTGAGADLTYHADSLGIASTSLPTPTNSLASQKNVPLAPTSFSEDSSGLATSSRQPYIRTTVAKQAFDLRHRMDEITTNDNEVPNVEELRQVDAAARTEIRKLEEHQRGA